MAFAISSGMPPQAGLYCAVVTGFIVSALGGSNVQIGGPTGAFVVVVSGIIAEHGIDGLFMCTMMAGVLLVIMGVTGTGTAVRFIPRPVVIGFTNGIALVIASTQIKDLLGIPLSEPVPAELVPRMTLLVENAGALSVEAALVGSAVLGLIVLWNRIVPGIPGYIVALIAGTAFVTVAQIPVDTIGTQFGGIPSGWPALHVPQFRPELILTLLSPTLTVAMLGAIESLMSAVVADKMTGARHNSNVELFAQGIANLASPLVGGLPATGAIARTATNIRSGARTPLAGMIHAVVLLGIVLVAAPLAASIPMTVLAAILLVVAYNMGEWREIPELWRQGWTDRVVWAGDVRADRAGGPHRGRRGGDDSRRAVVHPSRVVHDDGVTSDARLRRTRTRAHPAGQTDSRLHHDLSYSWTVLVRGHRQADGSHSTRAGTDANRGAAPAQHDGDRCNGTPRDSGFRRCVTP